MTATTTTRSAKRTPRATKPRTTSKVAPATVKCDNPDVEHPGFPCNHVDGDAAIAAQDAKPTRKPSASKPAASKATKPGPKAADSVERHRLVNLRRTTAGCSCGATYEGEGSAALRALHAEHKGTTSRAAERAAEMAKAARAEAAAAKAAKAEQKAAVASVKAAAAKPRQRRARKTTAAA